MSNVAAVAETNPCSNRVGAQFLGRARALRQAVADEAITADRRIAAICERIHARYRHGKPVARPSFPLSKFINHCKATISSSPGLRLLATMRAVEARMLGAAPGS